MTETLNLKIPPSLLRLGTDDVEELFITGLEKNVNRNDIQHLMDLRYPNRKRAANAMVRLVTNRDIGQFNIAVEAIRDKGIHSDQRLSLTSSYSRGILTIRVY